MSKQAKYPTLDESAKTRRRYVTDAALLAATLSIGCSGGADRLLKPTVALPRTNRAPWSALRSLARSHGFPTGS